MFFIFTWYFLASYNTFLLSKVAAYCSVLNTASRISSLLSSKCTNTPCIAYSNMVGIFFKLAQRKNTFKASVIFFRMGSWASSNLSIRHVYNYLSSSSEIVFRHSCKNSWTSSQDAKRNSGAHSSVKQFLSGGNKSLKHERNPCASIIPSLIICMMLMTPAFRILICGFPTFHCIEGIKTFFNICALHPWRASFS